MRAPIKSNEWSSLNIFSSDRSPLTPRKFALLHRMRDTQVLAGKSGTLYPIIPEIGGVVPTNSDRATRLPLPLPQIKANIDELRKSTESWWVVTKTVEGLAISSFDTYASRPCRPRKAHDSRLRIVQPPFRMESCFAFQVGRNALHLRGGPWHVRSPVT